MEADLIPADVLALAAPDLDPDLVQAQGGWSIDSIGAADWAMARLAELEADAARIVERANAVRAAADRYETDNLDARRRGPNGEDWPSIREAVARFRSLLEAYALEQRAAGNGTRLALVSGEVTTKSNPERVVITSEAALIDWAEGYGLDIVDVTKRVLVSQLRRIVKPIPDDDPDGHRFAVLTADDGQPMLLAEIPGVAVEPGHITATVKPDGL